MKKIITEELIGKVLTVIYNSVTNMRNADIIAVVNDLNNIPEDDSDTLKEHIERLEKEVDAVKSFMAKYEKDEAIS